MQTSLLRPIIICLTVSFLIGCSSDQNSTDVEQHQDTDHHQEMINELRAIRGLLEEIKEQNQGQKQPSKRPEVADIKLQNLDYLLGDKDAPVTIVEFTDYQCPYCKRFSTNTFPLLLRDYIEKGKVNWVVKDLPLAFHADAKKAAQAAYCAGDQGKFWEMRDALFRNSTHLKPENLKNYAEELGLKKKAFHQCIESDRYLAMIDENAKLAASQQLTGTPSFIVGKRTGDRLKGRVIVGAQSLAVFSAEIEKQLQ